MFRNAFSGFLLGNLSTAVRLVGFAALVRLLELEVYGTVLLAGYLLNYTQVFDGGVLQSLERFVPRFAGGEREGDLPALITLGMALLFGIGVCFSAALWGAQALGWLSGLGGAAPTDGARVVGVVVLLLPLVWTLQVLRHLGFGLMQHPQVYAIDLAVTAGGFALAVAGALRGAEAAELVALQAAPRVLMALPLWLAVRRVYRGRLLEWRLRELRRVGREVLPYTGWLSAMKGAVLIKYLAERVAPAVLLGVAAVPVFHGLLSVVSFVVGLNQGFRQVALPLASRLSSQDRGEELAQLAVRGTRVMTALFAPILVGVALFSPRLLQVLGGARFDGLAEGLAVELLLLSLLIPRAFASSLLLGEGSQIAHQASWAVATNLAYLLLCSLLLTLGGPEWGIVAHAASHLVFMPWLLWLLARSGLADLGALLRAAGSGLLPAWCVGLLGFWALWLGPPVGSAAAELAVIAAVAVALLLAAWRFGLSAELRDRLRLPLLWRPTNSPT